MIQCSPFGNLEKETWNTNLKKYRHPYVHCCIIDSSQDLEAAQVSISRWVDKIIMEHLYNGILLTHKKEENFTLCDSMDGPREYYGRWKKPARERQIPYDFTLKWNLMNKPNWQAK